MRVIRNRSVAALLLALAVAPALAGCTVAVVDPSAGAPSAQRTPAGTADGAEGSDAGLESPPAYAPAEAGDDDTQAQREALLAAVDTTMLCPDGPLTADGDIVRVEGHCEQLVIEIDAGVVIADDVDALTLAGSGTTVFVENVLELTVTGDASSVFWSGSTPDVSDSGAANVLKRG
ncbi:DUF3060 domain-containing protein [Microbacterium sp.]|uniref:DUF3060 domain-containing protein n=1 Tax=Microbacterium sp. TaxID=51671 RepID=UPI0039E57F8E